MVKYIFSMLKYMYSCVMVVFLSINNLLHCFVPALTHLHCTTAACVLPADDC